MDILTEQQAGWMELKILIYQYFELISKHILIFGNLIQIILIFLKKLEKYISISIEKLSSMDIIVDFLSTKLKLYDGIEITMQAIYCAAVKILVESVVESLVSHYELHFIN